jgi:lipid-A-disaccharide synthase
MSAERPRVFLVAGEPSGDALAAPLIAALHKELGPQLEIAGVGGTRMQAEGLASLFPMQELSLMGLVEVLPHLPRLWRRLRQTEAAIRVSRPDVVVTVDAPGFNFRLAERLRGSGIPVVHYVAPTV